MPQQTPVQLDDFDHRILIELERDGVLTAAALAERIGLSPSACHRRVKAMEAAGVIEGTVRDGKGVMKDYRYVDGAAVLPSREETRKLRPAD